MPAFLIQFGAALTASLIGLFLRLASPKILATIIVLSTERLVKKTSFTWDDKLLQKIKEEWDV